MYFWFKLLHVAAVVAFLGNITTGLFWHVHAARTRDPKLIAHVVHGIIVSDRIFTVPGVVFIIAAGVVAAMIGGYPLLRTGWILWSLVLFGVSGAAFMAKVAPLQRQMLAYAQGGAERGDFDYETYRALARAWEFWGAIALVTPFAALALMVLKPAL